MADPVLINPILTLAGQAAAFSANNDGIELKITHASFGTGHYDPTGAELALLAPVGSKIPMAGGSRPTPYQLRMVCSWREDVGAVAIGEIGFWSNDILVFIWSEAAGTIASYKTDGVTYVLFNDLTFAQVPASSINVDVDPNESVALAALAAHEGTPSAHPQYLLRADVAKDMGALSWLGLADGTANALTLTLVATESIIPAYAEGQRFQFIAIATNTGPVKANIEALGDIDIRKPVSGGLVPLEAGDIGAGVIYDLTFNGTYFQLNGGASGGGTSSVSVGSTFAPDVGAANAYKAVYLPAVSSLVDGLELTFLAKTDNTGASTFKPNDVLARPVLTNRYQALTATKITAGSICTIRYLASLDAWVLISVTGNAVPTTLAGFGITDAYTKAQMDALVGDQAKVVGKPTVTGSSSVTAGTVVALTASAASLLTGGSIATFTWTLPDGTSSTVAATSGSAPKSVTAVGSIGTNYVVSVYATDNAGNKSAVTTKSIAITSHAAPTAPTTVNVAATVYQSSTGNTLSASGAVASDGATITYSITQSGSVALSFSKTSGIAAGEVVTFSAPVVAADAAVTINVVAIDSMGGQSPVKATAITVAAVPSVAGAAYGGGFYAGRMKIGADSYALIVAPKASGESASLTVKPSNDSTAGTTSTWNGAANTAAMIAAGAAAHPAASFCKNLTIGGYTDWVLPAKDQLELLYRMLKPDATANNTSSGANPSSDPVGANYTAGSPAQTAIAAFKAGGSEAFAVDNYYWTSTEYSSTNVWIQIFSNGGQYGSAKANAYRVRAVRMIKI